MSRGDLDNDGEWNCDGGAADIGGVGATEAGLGVTGVKFASTTSPIIFFPFSILLVLPLPTN